MFSLECNLPLKTKTLVQQSSQGMYGDEGSQGLLKVGLVFPTGAFAL